MEGTLNKRYLVIKDVNKNMETLKNSDSWKDKLLNSGVEETMLNSLLEEEVVIIKAFNALPNDIQKMAKETPDEIQKRLEIVRAYNKLVAFFSLLCYYLIGL